MCELLTEIASYYSGKLAEYGTTPQGVDWNAEAGQILRFEQLTKVITTLDTFSLNDVGCGYGALFDYLQTKYQQFSYTGCDISPAMIDAAQKRNSLRPGVRYVVATKPPEIADYGIASGIFNVRLGRNDAEWQAYIHRTLDVLNSTSQCGFAFNLLSSYADPEKKREYLYYADPCALFDYCKQRYSRHVTLLHDYGLYEFTILLRKD